MRKFMFVLLTVVLVSTTMGCNGNGGKTPQTGIETINTSSKYTGYITFVNQTDDKLTINEEELLKSGSEIKDQITKNYQFYLTFELKNLKSIPSENIQSAEICLLRKITSDEPDKLGNLLINECVYGELDALDKRPTIKSAKTLNKKENSNIFSTEFTAELKEFLKEQNSVENPLFQFFVKREKSNTSGLDYFEMVECKLVVTYKK